MSQSSNDNNESLRLEYKLAQDMHTYYGKILLQYEFIRFGRTRRICKSFDWTTIVKNYQRKRDCRFGPQINEDANFTLKFDEIELILQNSPFFYAIQNLTVTLRCNKR